MTTGHVLNAKIPTSTRVKSVFLVGFGQEYSMFKIRSIRPSHANNVAIRNSTKHRLQPWVMYLTSLRVKILIPN